MTLTIHATYENGILKPAEPLPLKQHERVQVIVIRKPSLAEQTAGLIGWKGEAETFERVLAEAGESGIQPFSRGD
jgi:predicted DNA-binding antitoxin AbrB/MazE fold protein